MPLGFRTDIVFFKTRGEYTQYFRQNIEYISEKLQIKQYVFEFLCVKSLKIRFFVENIDLFAIFQLKKQCGKKGDKQFYVKYFQENV